MGGWIVTFILLIDLISNCRMTGLHLLFVHKYFPDKVESSVPKGHGQIAPDFNPGSLPQWIRSPEGTMVMIILCLRFLQQSNKFRRPYRTSSSCNQYPRLKPGAICQCPSGTKLSSFPSSFLGTSLNDWLRRSKQTSRAGYHSIVIEIDMSANSWAT